MIAYPKGVVESIDKGDTEKDIENTCVALYNPVLARICGRLLSMFRDRSMYNTCEHQFCVVDFCITKILYIGSPAAMRGSTMWCI